LVLFAVFFHFLLPPYILGRIVDFFGSYKTGDSLEPLYLHGALVGGFWIVASFIRLSAKEQLGKIVAAAIYRLRLRAFAGLVGHKNESDSGESTGVKIQRVQSGTIALQELARTLSSELLVITTSFVGVVFSFLSVKPLFCLLAIIYLIVFVGIQIGFYRIIYHLQQESNRALEDATGKYVDGLSNSRTLKALSVATGFRSILSGYEERARNLGLKAAALGFWKWRTFQVFNGLALTVFLVVLGRAVAYDGLSVGLVLTLFVYFDRLMISAGDSTNLIDQAVQQKVKVSRMVSVLGSEPSKGQLEVKAVPADWCEISMTNVVVRHRVGDRPALVDVSLSIPRGQKVGIVGASGSGKSTIARVLMGLTKPESGRCEIDQLDLATVDQGALASRIALVLQEVELFDLSVKENILLMRDVSPEQLRLCIHVAELESVIAELPQGVDTVVGEKGYSLSGGERQRIGIARGLVAEPDVLILDEATSSLDPETERAVMSRVFEVMADKTVIMITHREAILEHVDRVIVLDHGSIVRDCSCAEYLKAVTSGPR
jgi:ABC-type bacteriocin/lantibiotic exporter with double-glycine peptidase domain